MREALASDLQEMYLWEQEHTGTAVFASIEKYVHTETVLRQNKEQVEYHQFAKDFSCGEYSIIYQDGKVTDPEKVIVVQNGLLKQQLSELCTRLKEWCVENQSELNAAYIIPRHEGFLFLVVQKDNRYNTTFSRNLTLLENEIEESDNFSLIKFKVFEMPKNI
jgi:hypothetical protein